MFLSIGKKRIRRLGDHENHTRISYDIRIDILSGWYDVCIFDVENRYAYTDTRKSSGAQVQSVLCDSQYFSASRSRRFVARINLFQRSSRFTGYRTHVHLRNLTSHNVHVDFHYVHSRFSSFSFLTSCLA